MAHSFDIREYLPGDEDVCLAIYRDAIRNGTAPHYTAEEAAAWAPDSMDASDWAPRLASGRTWLAETESAPVGFITLDTKGHLDLFFVRPAARGLGVAKALYDRLIEAARSDGRTALTTDASHLARSFLEKRGWRVTGEERVIRHGVELVRFPMRLGRLPDQP